MTVKLEGTFEEVIDKMETLPSKAVYDLLSESVDFLINKSPVDTGAYIESHALSSGGSKTRSVNPRGIKKGTGNRSKAKEQLKGDLAELDFSQNTFVFNNHAKHAWVVENNPRGKVKSPHIYTQLQNYIGTGKVEVKDSNG